MSAEVRIWQLFSCFTSAGGLYLFEIVRMSPTQYVNIILGFENNSPQRKQKGTILKMAP